MYICRIQKQSPRPMKRKILVGIVVVLLLVVGYIGYVMLTPRASPSQTTELSYEGVDIKIVYCRPFKKGRLIFGSKEDGALQPYGQYWRLGANEATEISFSKDVNFAGQLLPEGTYRMYAVPGASTWTIALNSELGQSGSEEPNYSLDVLKVEIPAGSAPAETEQFVINLTDAGDGVNMDFVWDQTQVRVPITLP